MKKVANKIPLNLPLQRSFYPPFERERGDFTNKCRCLWGFKQTCLIFILFLSATVFCQAQSPNFAKRYDFQQGYDMGTQIITKGQGYYLFGVHDDQNTLHRSARVYQLDSSGNVIQSQTLVDMTNVNCYISPLQSVVKYNDSIFYMTGSLQFYDSTQTDSNRAFLVKYNANMQMLWLKLYRDSLLPTENYFAIKTGSGNLLNFGRQAFDSTLTSASFYLLKTDTAGNVLWWKKYGNYYNINPWGLFQTSDGGYLFYGGKQNQSGTGWAYIEKVDSNGNALWTYISPPSAGVAACAPLPNGDILATYILFIYRPLTNDYIEKIRVMRFNGQGQTLWSKDFGETEATETLKIIPLNDGNFLIPLYYGEPFNFIFKISGQGDSLWTRLACYSPYYPTLFDLYDVIQTSQGNLIAVGSFNPGNSPHDEDTTLQDAVVIKLDSNGAGMYPAPYNLTMNVTLGDSTKTIHLQWQDSAYPSPNRVYFIGFNQDPVTHQPIYTSQLQYTMTVPKDTINPIFFKIYAYDTVRHLFSLPSNTVTFTTGIKNLLPKQPISVRVFPNPNKGSFTLQYQFKQGNGCIFKLYNLQGKELFKDKLSGKSGTKQYKLNLSQGVYLYKIKTKNGNTKTGKIILTR